MLEMLIIIGALIVLVLYLWVIHLIATRFKMIAEMKGHDGKPYYRFCFWLGLVGWIMVAALPDRNGVQAAPRGDGNAWEQQNDIPAI